MDQPGVWRTLNIWFKDVKLWRARTGWSQPKHSQKVSASTENPTAWKGFFSNRQELCSHQWTVLSLWGTSLLCPHSLDVCITEDLRPASPSEKPYLGASSRRISASLGVDRGGKYSWAGGLGLSSAPQGPSVLGSSVSWPVLLCTGWAGMHRTQMRSTQSSACPWAQGQSRRAVVSHLSPAPGWAAHLLHCF